jgi:hypothetical protein
MDVKIAMSFESVATKGKVGPTHINPNMILEIR